jgi:hypothetical protein
MLKRLLPIAGIVVFAACATTHHGPMQRISVESNPDGALVELSNCGVLASKYDKTPTTVWVSRRSTQCTLTISKLGYRPVTMKLSRHVAPEFVGNAAATIDLCADDINCNSLDDFLLVGAIGAVFTGAGMATDAVSGAMFMQTPSRVDVSLCPSDEVCNADERPAAPNSSR